VPASGERQVLAGLRAPHVEDVRLGEYGRVSIGASQVGEHEGVLGQCVTGELRAAGRDASGHLHRALQAEHLLDGARPQRRVGTQHFALVRVLEQQRRAAPQQVHGRLETGRQQQQGGHAQLGVRQPPPILVEVHELAEQVVARVAAQPLQVPTQPGLELPDRGIGLLVAPVADADVEGRRRSMDRGPAAGRARPGGRRAPRR
jgi:hypothetical protein